MINTPIGGGFESGLRPAVQVRQKPPTCCRKDFVGFVLATPVKEKPVDSLKQDLMSSQSKKMMEPCFVVLGQLLLLWIVMVQGQNSTERTDTTSVTNPTGPNIAAIVAPTVILGLLAIAAVVLLLFFCVIRKKRQTEGTYRPSAEEQTGARGVQAPDALKLPKEERLI
ncbi:hypothetical protein Z043_100355 [Scleropages formosus]|uniref:Uncharacterized protein n=2 Tax=Scleropages formosus TaxID=113540 RepID=A0A0P7VTX7_SCLFO|nr:hypothetical protein Z043_100355 [Scleropages formosus]